MAVAKSSKEAHKIKINDSVTKFVHNGGKGFLKRFPVLLYTLLKNTQAQRLLNNTFSPLSLHSGLQIISSTHKILHNVIEFTFNTP